MKYAVLGPLELVGTAGPINIRGKRVRAMLGILLMSPGQVVSIDRMIDDIWLDDPPRSAVENIRTYVYQLRVLLDHSADRNVLESQPGGYRLNVDPDDLDATRFLRLVDEARKARRSDQLAAAAALLGEALALWRGAPLAGLELSPVMHAKAVALEEQRWQVEADWMQARLTLGEAGELVAPLRALVGERPLDERLWCLLLRALTLTGRTGEAVTTFYEARQTLVQELGIEPGSELRAIHASLLRGDGKAAAGPRPQARTAPVPHQLPTSSVDLAGRAEMLEQIQRLVQRSTLTGMAKVATTVLVSGPPGAGKTALAVTAAGQLRSELPDGEIYVDLRGFTADPVDPDDALASMLTAMGVLPNAIPHGMEGRRLLYRSLLAERRMLILLDDAAESRQVLPLLPGPGRSVLIVASRRRLTSVRAPLQLTLDQLTAEHAIQMLADAIGHDRVATEPAAAERIVQACGRLPGAIRIAAARLLARPSHPIAMLADRLNRGTGTLDEFTVDGASMREEFDRSYHALDPQAQRCFQALASCPADAITAALVAAVARLPLSTADRQLENLVCEGLLATGVRFDGTPTFRMPSLLHLYARERLQAEGLQDKALVS
ncbi:MAG TPA: BTAD domain-containing putative transcriptional regulator [Jatrophihabitans sp.]|nr:BTAD domain-containing putative transcriptional regulator [Jatrophihabitans sp.]